MLAVAAAFLTMWFSALGRPLVYGSVVVSLGVWIGLWPVEEPKLLLRLLIACFGSMGVCVVPVIVGEVIAFVRRDGLDEFGLLLFVPAVMVTIGLPVTVLASLVAAIGPRFRGRS